MKRLEFPSDHFVIPIPKGYLFYVPVKGLLYLVNFLALEQLFQALRDKESHTGYDPIILRILEELRNTEDQIPKDGVREEPFPWNRLILDLSTECTLACVYCYAHGGDSFSRSMSLDCATCAIDLSIAKLRSEAPSSPNNQPFYLILHGGSEPTTNWKLFTSVIDYARAACQEHDFQFFVSMSSNGYYPEDRAVWIAKNLNNVSLSLDGDPEVQDAQRPTRSLSPSSAVVLRSAEIFLNSQNEHFRFGLRPTITDFSVNRLTDIVGFFHTRFPGIAVRAEPVEECGRCVSSRFRSPDPYLFVEKFIEASEKYPDSRLSYSGFGGIGSLREGFCGISEPQFAVLPDGCVTACYGYSFTNEVFEKLIHARYAPETRSFILDNERRAWLQSLNGLNTNRCKNCFTKYHCGGDCPVIRLTEEVRGISASRGTRCVINRELAKWALQKETGNYAETISSAC